MPVRRINYNELRSSQYTGTYELYCPNCGAEQEMQGLEFPDPYDLVQTEKCGTCGKSFNWCVQPIEFSSWEVEDGETESGTNASNH